MVAFQRLDNGDPEAAVDAKGHVFIGFYGGTHGIGEYDINSEAAITRYEHPTQYVEALAAAADGSVFATFDNQNAIFRYDPATESLTPIISDVSSYGLVVTPEPSGLMLLTLTAVSVFFVRRR